jgi:hypothetical protein
MTTDDKIKAYNKSMYRMGIKQEAIYEHMNQYQAIETSNDISTWNGVQIDSAPLTASALQICSDDCVSLLKDFQEFCSQQQYDGFPTWSAQTAYKKYAQVEYSGVYYEALQDNTGNQPDTSSSDWVVYDIENPNS